MKLGNTSFTRMRLFLICFGNVLILTGLCLTLSAMFTSGWQIAYSEDRVNGIYEHGLYRDCVRGQDNIRPSNDWVCFWKFDQNNHIQTDRFFKFREYQESTLILLGVSCGLALAAMICGCVTCGVRYCNIPWAVAVFLTGLTSLIGLGVFFRNSSVSDNRFIRMYNYEVDMWYGSSLYICIAGFICYVLAFFLSVLCVVLSFMEMRNETTRGRTPIGGSSISTTTNASGNLFGSSKKGQQQLQQQPGTSNVAGVGANRGVTLTGTNVNGASGHLYSSNKAGNHDILIGQQIGGQTYGPKVAQIDTLIGQHIGGGHLYGPKVGQTDATLVGQHVGGHLYGPKVGQTDATLIGQHINGHLYKTENTWQVGTHHAANDYRIGTPDINPNEYVIVTGLPTSHHLISGKQTKV